MLWRSIAPARRPEGFIEPCLPTLGHAVPSGPQWAYEIKHDGFRFICRRYGDRVRVFSRRGNDYTDRVPAIAEALAALRVKSVTLDGEGVVCGEDGVTDLTGCERPLVVWARGMLSSMCSICWKLTAPIYAETNSTCGGRRWQACCTRPAKASDCRSISTARTATQCLRTLASSNSKASSPSAGTGRIIRVARRIGSRSRTRRRRQ